MAMALDVLDSLCWIFGGAIVGGLIALLTGYLWVALKSEKADGLNSVVAVVLLLVYFGSAIYGMIVFLLPLSPYVTLGALVGFLFIIQGWIRSD